MKKKRPKQSYPTSEMAGRLIKEATNARNNITIEHGVSFSYIDVVELFDSLSDAEKAVILQQVMRKMAPTVVLSMFNDVIQGTVIDLVFEDQRGPVDEEEEEYLRSAEMEERQQELLVEINQEPKTYGELLQIHRPGQVWTPESLVNHFVVHTFCAPLAVVTRMADGAIGSVKFQHEPRFYFEFEPDPRKQDEVEGERQPDYQEVPHAVDYNLGRFTGVQFDRARDFGDGRKFRIITYQAVNAGGLIGHEMNGVAVLYWAQRWPVLVEGLERCVSAYNGVSKSAWDLAWNLYSRDWEYFNEIMLESIQL